MIKNLVLSLDKTHQLQFFKLIFFTKTERGKVFIIKPHSKQQLTEITTIYARIIEYEQQRPQEKKNQNLPEGTWVRLTPVDESAS